MSKNNMKPLIDQNGGVELDRRASRHHRDFEEAIVVRSDDCEPRLRKGYYKLVEDGVLATFSNEQVMHFRRYASQVFTWQKPTVRQAFTAMAAEYRDRKMRGHETVELCSERTFHRLVGEMRQSAAQTERLMALYSPADKPPPN